jgi:hypothetical protein
MLKPGARRRQSASARPAPGGEIATEGLPVLEGLTRNVATADGSDGIAQGRDLVASLDGVSPSGELSIIDSTLTRNALNAGAGITAHALVRHLGGVCVPQLVRCEPTPDATLQRLRGAAVCGRPRLPSAGQQPVRGSRTAA